MPEKPITLELAGREVKITNPGKVFFPQAGYTKLDIVNYFLAVAEGALVGVRNRPMVLKRSSMARRSRRLPEARPRKTFLRASKPRMSPSQRTFGGSLWVDDVADLAWGSTFVPGLNPARARETKLPNRTSCGST